MPDLKKIFALACAALVAAPLLAACTDTNPDSHAQTAPPDLSATVSVQHIGSDFQLDHLQDGLHKAVISNPGQDDIACYIVKDDSFHEGYAGISCDFNGIGALSEVLTPHSVITTQKIADFYVDSQRDGMNLITITEKDGTQTECLLANDDSYKEGYAALSCNF